METPTFADKLIAHAGLKPPEESSIRVTCAADFQYRAGMHQFRC
jgi:hypothetical protein